MKRRKGLAFILALSLVLSSFSVAFATDVAEETTPVTETTTEAVAPVATATNTAFADIAGHWAKDAIVKWADYGVVKGSDGVFRPDAPLTRAEMATVLSNLMDYKVAAKNNFSDVATGAWYADAVLKANAAGVLSGDGSGLASPSANITREQATSMLARAFAVADANGTSSSLTDTQNISSWARPAVFGMEAAGYVRGFEGKFNPKNNITRAEVITIINSAVKAYYTAAGTYTENVDGLAVVKVPGVVLKDVVISGNLIAAEGIASGDLTLDGKTEVKGKLIVRGGGENSIIIKGSATVLSIEVSKVDGKVRIFADGALIKEITALKGEIILEGNFTNVEVKADATVIIKGNVGTLSMESKGTVDIQSGTVTTLDIPAGATATVAANATVTTANITGAADIKGTGAIGTANISGTGATIVQTPTAVNVADGGAATVGGKTVDGATSAAPSSGGGRGNSSNTVAVSAININKSTTTLVQETTETLTATFTPSNASNKTITWTTSDASKATIDSTGKVRAVSAGTATITAKSNNGKTATCVVTVTTTVVPVSAISVKGTGDATTIETNGGTLQMIATVSPDNASNKAVTWSVTNNTIATINASGLLTAKANGTVTVTATAQDGSGKSDSIDITITNQIGPDKNITSVATLAEINVAYGTNLSGVSLPTTVEVTLEDSTTRNLAVTWNGGTPSYNGNTTGEYVFEGTLTLEAGVKNTSSLKATIKVIVAPQEKVAPPVITASTTTTTNRDAGVKFTVGAVDGVTFYYTLDGTTPTSSSTKYTGEVTVTAPDVDTVATVNIKVIGIKAGFINSDVVTKPVTYLAKDAATYAVTVTNGTGGGNYVEGATVTITANAADSDKQFDKWTTTDGVVFANANSPNTTFTMPNKTVTVTATYKDIVVTGVTIKTPPTKTTYITGETLNLTGLVVTLTKSDLSTEDVAFADFGTSITTSPENGTALSVVTTGVTITVNGKTVTQSITVTLPVMTGTVTITGDAKFGATLTANPSLTNAGTPTYQWNRGGVAISGATASTYKLVEADITKTITVTVTAQESVGTGSITSDPTAVIEKADGPSAPAAPTEASKTDTSITLTANALHQFSKDNGVTWQDSEVFTGLTPSTEYTFVARIKATTTTKESAASSGITIKTSAPAPVSVTGVSLNQTTMSLKVGTGTGTLTATIAPANAANKTVTWESSNTSVATVDSNGKVTPVATGTTTITVTTADGSKTATCTVTVTAANIANAVLVGGNGEANTLKSDFPYWVNGARSKTGTLGSEGCTAFFDHLTGILTLHGYNGGEIKSSFASEPDLIIKLIGTNKVTTLSQVGIENGYSGNIYITAENDASLEINSDSTQNSYGIATGHISGDAAGSVVIGGKAKVTIDAETTGTSNTAIGIRAKDDVTIHENADLTIITKTAGSYDNNGIFAGNNITINTTKNIAIDISTNTKGLVLSRSTIINNVNLMTLKAPTDGGFIFGTPDLSGVAVNIAGKVASYRSGTPYTIEVKNGEITGVAAGVIVQAGQPYQALANDIITIKANENTNFEFVKWTNQDGTALDSSLFVSPTAANSSVAKIKMPANNLNIKAQYKSTLFTTQPVFHRGDEKITWKISQAADFGYLQKKTGETWGDTSISLPRTLEGTATVRNNPGNHYVNAPDGTYRLAFYFNPNDNEFLKHYSEQFEIAWNAQLAGTVTISGTPKSGATLTANAIGTQVDAGELKYQWFADSTEISGATEKTLVLGADQVGKQIKVKVSSHNYNMPIESAPTAAVAKADGPGAIDSYTGTSEVETNIKLAGLGASTNLEVAVAIDGSTYDEYRDLSVDGDGKASIFGLTGVNASTKVKVRIKESPTHFAGADREITVTVAADTTPPVITASDKILPIANLADWTETVWATDDVDGSISGNVVATYFQSDGTTSLTDLAAAKEYIGDATTNTSFVIKYNVSDAAGNEATEVTVTITVTKANVPDSISVGGKTLNSTTPYLVDGTPATTGTLGAGNCTAHFDPITGDLSLQGYAGQTIQNMTSGKDLSIKLIGNNNKITGGQFGIHNDSGDIHITSDNEALLEIEIKSSSDGAAIANGWGAMTENPSVFIGGKAKVTVKAEYTGEQTTNSITGIYAGRGSVIIQDQADYSATLTNSEYQGRGISSNGKTIINTSGNIEIDVSNSLQGIGIYGNSGIEIQQVNSMLITIPSTGGTNTKFTSGTVDVSSGVAVNKSTTKASYRSGTPYTLGLEGGNITSATGGVIGSPHQYLVDDEITIESTISEFDRWTKANGAALETSLFIKSTTANTATATIKMPVGSLSIKAREMETGTVIDIAAIPGVVAPVTGATPVTKITETTQYTGTVEWLPADTKFAGDKVYTAKITLKAKDGYKLDGVAANYFTVAGATTVTNEKDTGEITAVFPTTEADTLIDIAEIPGVVAPVTGKTPVTKITETVQYTGTVAWTPANNPFAAKTVYTAKITLTAKPGFKLDGVIANFFTVNGIATTHVEGVVTVEFPATAASDFATGSGTELDPYQVSSAEELNKVRNHLEKHFKQTANIDLSTYTADEGWQPIGDSTKPFKGTYDGNNFKISNLTINRPDANAQGLFGYITHGSVLENISLTTVNVKGKSYVGGLVGSFNNGTITSCNVVGTVNGQDYVGGLVGLQSYGTITSSYTSGTVNGTDIVGGLVGGVGSGEDVKVTNSYSLASVTATTTYGRVGGLVGLTWKAIENCYAAGQVTGNVTNAGGLVGENKGTITTITSSYYDSEKTGQSDEGKGVKKTTAEMKQAATFTGWDTSIWNIKEGSYPTLK